MFLHCPPTHWATCIMYTIDPCFVLHESLSTNHFFNSENYDSWFWFVVIAILYVKIKFLIQGLQDLWIELPMQAWRLENAKLVGCMINGIILSKFIHYKLWWIKKCKGTTRITSTHQCNSWPFCPYDGLRFFIRFLTLC